MIKNNYIKAVLEKYHAKNIMEIPILWQCILHKHGGYKQQTLLKRATLSLNLKLIVSIQRISGDHSIFKNSTLTFVIVETGDA
jgi:hypothetical protein